jgi:predicted nucleic acid-binding protein
MTGSRRPKGVAGPVVLDASVIVGVLDATDPHHVRSVDAVRAAGARELVVPAVAYAEVMVGAFRRGKSAIEPIEGFFHQVVARIEPVCAPIAREAARIRAKHPALSLTDALTISTGEALAAERILTADLRWRGVSPLVDCLAVD